MDDGEFSSLLNRELSEIDPHAVLAEIHGQERGVRDDLLHVARWLLGRGDEPMDQKIRPGDDLVVILGVAAGELLADDEGPYLPAPSGALERVARLRLALGPVRVLTMLTVAMVMVDVGSSDD